MKVLFVTLCIGAAAFGFFSFNSKAFGDKVPQADAHSNANSKDKTNSGLPESKSNSQNVSLLEAPLSPKLAVAGGDISIVDNSALQYRADTAPDAYQSDQISTYVVRSGDTLSEIAKMFDVSVNTIIWANDIGNGTIAPGQTLIILPISGVKHVVEKGETIQSITKAAGADLTEVLQFNNLKEDSVLTPGDLVIIPSGEASAVSPTSSTENKKTTTKSNSKTNSKPNYAGYYKEPLAHFVKTQGLHGHNAVDLAAPVGTPIMAAASGKVIIAKVGGWNGGYGNYVVIAHPNGTQTLYAHMSTTATAVGASVSQGEVVGYIGLTGETTGPHLHVEVRGARNPF